MMCSCVHTHETVVSEHAAMVRRVNNQRVMFDSYLLQCIDKHPDCSIDFTNCGLELDGGIVSIGCTQMSSILLCQPTAPYLVERNQSFDVFTVGLEER